MNQMTDTNVMTWTAARLLAGAQPAYGSDCASPAKPAAGSIYALPRRRPSALAATGMR